MPESNGLGKEQMTLVITGVFTLQMTSEVKEVHQENNILVTNVHANMTGFYQPLDLTINGSAKRFITKKFNAWYSDQISEELQSGTRWNIDVKLRLSILKPLNAGWVVDFYKFITSAEGKEVILNG